MANEKILDMTKSAADNETAVNQKFNELEQQGGGISLDDLKAEVTQGEYGTSLVIGDNVELPTTPARLIEAVNTIRMIKDMIDSVLNVSGEYGHEPNMVIHDGKIYLAYMYQTTGTGEGQSQGLSKVRLSIIPLSTMAVEKHLLLAENGTTVVVDGETKTMTFAGSPNVALLGSTVRVAFTAGIGGEGEEIICYRDYDIANDALGNISVCNISKDGQTLSATLSHFKSLIENAGASLQVHSQYAHINDKYYIVVGNGTSGKNGNIFTTTDFINFEWWAKPDVPDIGENLGFEYEMALYPWSDAWNNVCLYIAMRRYSGSKTMIVAKILVGMKYEGNQFVDNATDKGKTAGYIVIPCNSSRPCFFSPATNDFLSTRRQVNIFLNLDNVAQQYPYRKYTDIDYFTQNTFAVSTIGRIAQCLTMTYPSIVYHDGYYYVAYQGYTTGNQPHILLSKFRPFSANWDKVIAGLSKMLDTFEPSES